MATISPSRFADIIAAARLKKQMIESSLNEVGDSVLLDSQSSEQSEGLDIKVTKDEEISNVHLYNTTDKYGNLITYNSLQSSFMTLASTHKSCILIGAAGTGKTTAMKGTVQSLIQSPHTSILQNHDHKHLLHGVPGIVICAYTRRATNNIRRNMDESMKANCLTIHKLLEYAPHYYDILDESGNNKTSMRFEPSRNHLNPLPSEITTIIFEESSMIGLSLYAEVIAALPNPDKVQIIFLGDIQQLPPVFGAAILGYKLLELPTIELTEVYRQALQSPIIRLAHRILSGKVIKSKELESEWNVEGLTIKPWKKKIEPESALAISEKLFSHLYSLGQYDPKEDMILIPFNKSYGSIELNKSIANHLAKGESRIVWEVVAGFMKHYFSVGDKVLYDREDAIILDIYPNPAYTGAMAQQESEHLDYWGNLTQKNADILPSNLDYSDDQSDADMDFLLAQVAVSDSDSDRVTQSSHYIKLQMQDSDSERLITKAAEVNALLLGYCLTVHKAQGSEWNKVFLLLHNSHATMINRELVYTAVTRAKESLFIVCEQDTFEKGITRQRIKGDTLAEKAEYFKGRIDQS